MLRDEIKFRKERPVSRRTKYYFAGLIINGAGRAPNPAGNPGKAQRASAPRFTSGKSSWVFKTLEDSRAHSAARRPRAGFFVSL